MPGPWDEDPSGSIGIHRMGMDRDGMGMGWPMMSMREWMEWMGMAHDEHEGFGPLHDGWGWDAPTLMRMAHMMRMMDGHGMAWVNIDKRFDGIFGWGWGWDVMGWGWDKKSPCD